MSSFFNLLSRLQVGIHSRRIAAAVFFGFLASASVNTQAAGVITNLTRQALVDAMSGGGNVTFGAGVTGTITVSNQITVSSSTFLNGAGRITIAGVGGTNGSRIFNVRTGVTFSVTGLTLQNGRATNGGAIYNRGTLIASNCNFRNNSAVGRNGANGVNRPDSDGTPADGGAGVAGSPARGGAIFNSGRTTLIDCVFDDNTATGGNGGNGGKGGNAVGGAFEGGDGGRGGNGGVAQGGAVYNGSILTVRDCTFTANNINGGDAGQAGDPGTGPIPGTKPSGGIGGNATGGAVFTARRSTISTSTFANNVSTGGDSGDGGVQDNGDGANGPDGGQGLGGALSNTASNGVINCTFYRNRVFGGDGGDGGSGGFEGGDGGDGGDGIGGSVYNSGRMGITNCTLSGGSAFGGKGGTNGTGLVAGSPGSLGSRLGGNVATVGGRLVMVNSILDDANSAGNGHGAVVDAGANISSDNSIALPAFDSRVNLNPRLEPLEENGGPTETMALRPGSPALDAARESACPATDQRGVGRFGAGCDIGAFEFEISSIRGRVTNEEGGGVGGITITANGATNTTDSDGFYAFEDLDAGNYVVTASAEGLRFVPPSYSFTLVAESNAVDFVAIPLPVMTGRVVLGTNGLPGVVISTGTNSVITDTNGDFRLFGFPTNTPVTITPQLVGFDFEPPSRTLTVTSNIDVGNFVAVTNITVGGRIIDTASLPVANVTVTVGSRTGTTGTNGYYQVNELSRGSNYVVRPQLSGYQFQPSSESVTLAATVTNVNFTAVGLFSIVGRVTLDGQPAANVRITATSSAGVRTVTTDVNGNYQFSELGPATYVVRPVHSGYQFNPVSHQFVLSGNINSADFAGTLNVTVNGRVLDGENPQAGLPGVSITITNRAAITDDEGFFTITNVPGGTHVVRASLGGYEFEPAQIVRTFTVDETLPNVTGYPIFTISGSITEGTNRVAGVFLQASNYVAATDTNGVYDFSNVRKGTYNVVPSFEGYTFSPASAPATVGPNVANLNFQAVGIYTISGRVTLTDGSGLSGVDVVAGTRQGRTDINGDYRITQLAPGTHIVRASRAQYAFEPLEIPVTVGPDNRTAINFTARPAFSVSGRITSGGFPVSGVTVEVSSGGVTNRAITDSITGGYTVTNVSAGAGRLVIPKREGFAFSPSQRIIDVNGTVLGMDFSRVFTIEGSVLDGSNGLFDATILITNQTFRRETFTTTSGSYNSGLLEQGTYTVTPRFAGKTFLPAARVVAAGPSTNKLDKLDFSAIYGVAGRVLKGGSGLAGVSVSLASNIVTTTDMNGFFGFTNVLGGAYTVIPTLGGNGFDPATNNIILGPNRLDLEFRAFNVFNVSGAVSGPSGGPVQGATVSAGGKSATTAANGTYTIVGLAPASYTVIAAKPCYTFLPASVTLGPSANNVNFSGSFQSFTLGGQVRNGANIFTNVLITVNGQATFTDTNGFYYFSNACAGSNMVTATLAGFYFNTNYILDVNTDRFGLDFTPLPLLFISGHILDDSGEGIGGVRIQLESQNNGQATTTTNISNAQGAYSFPVAPGTYTLRPFPEGRFRPATTNVAVASANVSGITFIIDPLRFTSIVPRGANGIELSLLGFPNENYTLEASTNLVNWSFLHSTNAPPSTNALSNGFFIYLDSAVTNIPKRFYRAVNF